MVRATAAEADFVRRLLVGELRQGALEGVMVDAIARASEVPAAVVRRAHMLGGRLGPTARLALFEGREALEAVGLEVGRGVRPMLAATAASVEEALAELGTCSVEWKLDGARIQVHRRGDEVVVYTRNLNDVTARLPDVVAAARALPVRLGRARRRDADDGRGGPAALLPGLDVALRRRRGADDPHVCCTRGSSTSSTSTARTCSTSRCASAWPGSRPSRRSGASPGVITDDPAEPRSRSSGRRSPPATRA